MAREVESAPATPSTYSLSICSELHAIPLKPDLASEALPKVDPIAPEAAISLIARKVRASNPPYTLASSGVGVIRNVGQSESSSRGSVQFMVGRVARSFTLSTADTWCQCGCSRLLSKS